PAIQSRPVESGKSNTCKFNSGPRAGQTQRYPGFPPIPIGSPCYDGMGSTGTAVNDDQAPGPAEGSPSLQGLPNTCSFKSGPRAGQTQSYPGFPPIPIGSPCHDGAGSTGVVVAGGAAAQAGGGGMGNSCKFNNGPRAGQTQDYS